MTDYPRLKEMGVVHPEQIAYFSVSSINYTDFLRIVYDRPKASLLPASRSYRFPRVQAKAKKGADADEKVVMESNPAFKEAVAELQALMGTKERKQDIAAEMLDELRQLEEEFAMHAEYMRALIEKIQKV